MFDQLIARLNEDFLENHGWDGRESSFEMPKMSSINDDIQVFEKVKAMAAIHGISINWRVIPDQFWKIIAVESSQLAVHSAISLAE